MKIPSLLSCLFALSLICCEVFAACVPQPGGATIWRGDGPYDASGNLAGSFRAGGRVGDGFIGSGFVFGGGQDALLLPAAFRLPSQEFTVEAWVRRSDTNRTGIDPIGGQLFGGGNAGISFGLTHEGRPYLNHIGLTNYFTTSAIRDTNWHHVAVARGGTDLRFER